MSVDSLGESLYLLAIAGFFHAFVLTLVGVIGRLALCSSVLTFFMADGRTVCIDGGFGAHVLCGLALVVADLNDVMHFVMGVGGMSWSYQGQLGDACQQHHSHGGFHVFHGFTSLVKIMKDRCQVERRCFRSRVGRVFTGAFPWHGVPRTPVLWAWSDLCLMN